MKHSAIAALSLMTIFATGCGSSHLYYSEAQVYVKELSQEMARAGLSAQGRIFFEAGGWEIGPFQGGGIHVTTYEINDPALGKRLIDRATQLHAQFPGVPVTVTVYSNQHTDSQHPGKSNILARTEIRK